jgi:hypothetical protein
VYKSPVKISEGVKHDNDKPMMSLLPFDALVEVSKVLTFGAKKYAPDNWKIVPNYKERYESALLRHFSAYKSGELKDNESDCSHLAHLVCCGLFLLYKELEESEGKDDVKN